MEKMHEMGCGCPSCQQHNMQNIDGYASGMELAPDPNQEVPMDPDFIASIVQQVIQQMHLQEDEVEEQLDPVAFKNVDPTGGNEPQATGNKATLGFKGGGVFYDKWKPDPCLDLWVTDAPAEIEPWMGESKKSPKNLIREFIRDSFEYLFEQQNALVTRGKAVHDAILKADERLSMSRAEKSNFFRNFFKTYSGIELPDEIDDSTDVEILVQLNKYGVDMKAKGYDEFNLPMSEILMEFKQPKSFDPDTLTLVREMLEVADIHHDELVDDVDTLGLDEVSSFLDKRSGGTYFKFPHYNGPRGRGALFGKDVSDQIARSKEAAKSAALKTYTKFKTYIEDYEISDVSPAGVYGNIYLWVMFNDLAKDYSAPKGGTQSSQLESDIDEGSCGYGPNGSPGNTPGETNGMQAQRRTNFMRNPNVNEGGPGTVDDMPAVQTKRTYRGTSTSMYVPTYGKNSSKG